GGGGGGGGGGGEGGSKCRGLGVRLCYFHLGIYWLLSFRPPSSPSLATLPLPSPLTSPSLPPPSLPHLIPPLSPPSPPPYSFLSLSPFPSPLLPPLSLPLPPPLLPPPSLLLPSPITPVHRAHGPQVDALMLVARLRELRRLRGLRARKRGRVVEGDEDAFMRAVREAVREEDSRGVVHELKEGRGGAEGHEKGRGDGEEAEGGERGCGGGSKAESMRVGTAGSGSENGR
ncbi:unnamed protein product, partial [Closterium sp. NIES-65]